MRLAVAAAAVAAALFAAPAASASTVVITGSDSIAISAGPGETNFIESDNGTISDKAGITGGEGCRAITATKVDCDMADNIVRKTVVDLGDGDDYFHDQSVAEDDIDAGAGNDEVYGGSAADIVRGGAGDDKISGSSGDDKLDGGDGNDHVSGNQSSDTIFGGRGRDTLEGDGQTLDNGSDKISAEDGEKDLVSCDGGADMVTADTVDTVDEYGCENVERKNVTPDPGPDPDPGTADTTAPTVSVKLPTSLKLSSFLKNGFSFSATFSETVAFAAVLYVPAKTARKYGLGNKDTRIAQGGGVAGAGTSKARLTKLFKVKQLRALLKRKGFTSLPVVFDALAQDAAENITPLSRKLRLRR